MIERLSCLFHHRFTTADEAEFQDEVAEVLTAQGIIHRREHSLSEFGVIDFYLPGLCAGVELKVAGSPATVRRQLARYARSDEIEHLVLLTPRKRLCSQPKSLGGKPLHTICTWMAQF